MFVSNRLRLSCNCQNMPCVSETKHDCKKHKSGKQKTKMMENEQNDNKNIGKDTQAKTSRNTTDRPGKCTKKIWLTNM